ncbi:MAG: S-adenosylmethionine decarboxylase [Patescibacteria group bacterium]
MFKGKNNKKEKQKIFGQELILDLYGCDLEIMQSKKKIKEFCKKICELIRINRVGEPFIRNTGKGDLAGYSICQFLETSSIIIHTCDPILEIYLNVFSCRLFDNKKAVDFTKRFFKPKKMKKIFLLR